MTPSSLAIALALSLTPRLCEPADAPPAPEQAAVEVHGRVILDSTTKRMGLPAVTFDHWLHRALYSCRVCHVDLGFAVKAGETEISAAGNEEGAHCGACHNGKTLQDGQPIFAACSGWPRADPERGCTRCHTGATPAPSFAYAAFKRRMPLDSADLVDWSAAVRRGLIKPADAVAGVSRKRVPMKIDRDVSIDAVGTWLENVTFSHRKHVQWNGCELCHPEVFPVTRRGSVSYGMEDIRAGKFCGVCHVNVAFPLDQCQRCHAEQNRSWRQ